ncbi:MAG: hypothetical protein OHK0045_03290 [Raineya sp.]
MQISYTYFCYFFLYFAILRAGYGQQVGHLQNLEEKWQKNPTPEIALQIAQELVDERTDKALYYVRQAQKNAGKHLRQDILLLLTEIHLRKHHDKEAERFYQELEQIYQKDSLNPKYLFVKSFWLSLHKKTQEVVRILGSYLSSVEASSLKDPHIAILYLEYAANLMRVRDYHRALAVLEDAEEVYKNLNMQKHLGKLYNLRGLIHKNLQHYTLAIESYVRAVKVYRAYNPLSRNLAVTYVNLGNIYTSRYKDTTHFKEAERVFWLGAKLCQEIKDTVQLIHFYERLGYLFLLQKKTAQAKQHFEKGFALATKIGSLHLQHYHQLRLADAYFADGQRKKAIQVLQNILPEIENGENIELLSEAYRLLANFHQQQNEHLKALTYLQKGVDFSRKNQILFYAGLFYQNQIPSLLALNRVDKAQQINDTLRKIFPEDRNWHLEIFKNQKKIDSARGDFQAALRWASQYQTLKDSLHNVEKIESFNEVQQRFWTEEKQKENDLLRLQNEQEKANNTLKTYFLLILGGVLLLLFFLASNWWFKHKNLKIINQKMIEQEKQIREYAAQLAENNKILHQKNEFDSKLLAIISHDLRGPVHSVSTLLDMINRGMFEEEEKDHLLQLAHGSLYGAGQLLDNLLLWAKSHQSDFKPNIQEVAIKQLADEVVDMLKLQADQKGLYLHNRIDSTLKCLAEPEVLQIVLRNLLANAIKFTQEGGVSVEAIYGDTYCEIIVKDTGVGIPKESLKNIFKKSFHTQGTKKEKGTGLGLMLSKEFVERNGGDIRVDSKLGQGTTFTIIFPKINQQLASDNQERYQVLSSSSNI